MLPYWLLFTLFAGGALLNSGRSVEHNRASILFIVAMFATTLMIGLRFEVGGDWIHYLDFYERMPFLTLGRGIRLGDPGYSLLNWLVSRAGLGMWAVNLACAAIFTMGLTSFAKRQPNPWLAVLVAVPYLIIVVAMGYTRQAAAIGFIMWGLTAFDRGHIRRFAFAVLLAVTFHQTALLVLPLGIISVTRNRTVTYAMLVALGLGMYYIFVQSNVDRLFNNYVATNYSSQGALTRVAMNLPAALLLILARKQFAMRPETLKLWTNMAVAAILCLVLLFFSDASTAVDRLALYLIPLQMVALVRIPYMFGSGGRNQLAWTALLVGYSAAIEFTWLNYAAHSGYWLPYENYLWQ